MKRERVVAFPFARRRGLILRLAGQMVARKPAKAERYLREQLRRQIAALHLRQVSDRAVEKEIGALRIGCTRGAVASCAYPVGQAARRSIA